MRKKNIFWGIFFVLAAVAVVVTQLGIVRHISVWAVLATTFWIWVLAESVRHRRFYGIMFSIAFLSIIYDKPLGIETLTPWPVLVAALLSSIGLSMLFDDKKKHKEIVFEWNVKNNENQEGSENNTKQSAQYDGEHIYCQNNFGSAIRYINSDNFHTARLENNFGEMKVYFDNAIIQGDVAYVDIDNNFGETILYIPKEWKVKIKLDPAFGKYNEYGTPIGSSNATLYVQGEANFGHISIYYV